MDMEGVIKFTCQHQQEALSDQVYGAVAGQLDAWRLILRQTGLMGQDPERYEGAGFGNLSARLSPPSLPRGRRRFLISGSQTGHMEHLRMQGLSVVEHYDSRENWVSSKGVVLPSSESLTHAAIYDLSSAIRFVFHVHSPAIWSRARELRLPQTSAEIAYGTQEMAREVQRLYRSSSLSDRRVLAMRGHQDGVIAFGHSAGDAGLAIMRELAAAYVQR